MAAPAFSKWPGKEVQLPLAHLHTVMDVVYSETSEQWTLWDQYKFKWILPCIEVVLFKRFQLHYIDKGDKIWGFSFVHCGEVYNTLSLYRRVLFERFYCISNYF